MTSEFYSAWQFLSQHAIFTVQTIDDRKTFPLLDEKEGKLSLRHSMFSRGLSFYLVKVEPVTGEIDLKTPTKNTLGQLWFEVSTPTLDEDAKEGYVLAREDRLNLSSQSFEQGLILLAERVRCLYGEDLTSAAICLDNSTPSAVS